MLPVAIGILVVGTVYTVLKAPRELAVTAILLIVVATALGAAAGTLFAADDETATYYPIAGAIAGWIVGAAIYDHKRKKHLHRDRTD